MGIAGMSKSRKTLRQGNWIRLLKPLYVRSEAARRILYDSPCNIWFLGVLPATSNCNSATRRQEYEILKVDPDHPSLHFKKVGPYRSVRVGIAYRALGVEDGGTIVWFWIGNHDEYERLING